MKRLLTTVAVAPAFSLAVLSCADTSSPVSTSVPCDASSVSASAATTVELTVEPCPIDLGSGEGVTVVFTLTALGLSDGISSSRISGTTPAGVTPACSMTTPHTGTARDGSWQCTWVLNDYSEPGVWMVRAVVSDSADRRDTLEIALPIANARGDTSPPILIDLAFSEARQISQGIEFRELVIAGADSAAGMWRLEIGGAQDDPMLDWSCAAEVGVWPEGPTSPGTWSPQTEYRPLCPMVLVDAAAPVYWTIREVRLKDLRGNQRLYDALALQQAGFITQIDVSK